jgi:hypothetical protein
MRQRFGAHAESCHESYKLEGGMEDLLGEKGWMLISAFQCSPLASEREARLNSRN